MPGTYLSKWVLNDINMACDRTRMGVKSHENGRQTNGTIMGAKMGVKSHRLLAQVDEIIMADGHNLVPDEYDKGLRIMHEHAANMSAKHGENNENL